MSRPVQAPALDDPRRRGWERAQKRLFADRHAWTAWLTLLDAGESYMRAAQVAEGYAREWERRWALRALRRTEAYLSKSVQPPLYVPTDEAYSNDSIARDIATIRSLLRSLPQRRVPPWKLMTPGFSLV